MAEMTIRRFGVLSIAKMYSLMMFVMGLIFGVIFGLFSILLGVATFAMGDSDQAVGVVVLVVVGLASIIGIPITYGVLGFIIGIIGALVYNLAAGRVGGVKLELEGSTTENLPLPPPQQWTESHPSALRVPEECPGAVLFAGRSAPNSSQETNKRLAVF